MSAPLRLRDVRAAFRLIGQVRAMGEDPARWRPHMVRRLRRLFGAEVVVSSEVHVRATRPARGGPPLMRVIDVGWGCDGADAGHVWRVHSEGEAPPDAYMLSVIGADPGAGETADPVPVRPTVPVRGGSAFILSQYPLAHLGAIDQLGLHRESNAEPFTAADHRLVRLFHVELGRLWRRDAVRQAGDPLRLLPPRLAQTLAALQAGCSEKEVSARLGISPHTVHDYVKALHHRLGVTSRGELLARTSKPPAAAAFVPQLSVRPPDGR